MADLTALEPVLQNLKRSGEKCWTAANCPTCTDCRPDGDRLRIWPNSEPDGSGSWSCRRCGAHGDLPDLLMRLRPELSFPMAWRQVVGTEPPMQAKAKAQGKGGTWWTRLQRQRAEARQALARTEAERRARELEPVLAQAASAAVRLHRRASAPAPRPLPPSEWRGTVGSLFHGARAALLTEPAATVWLQDRGLTPEAAYAAGCFGWISRNIWLDYARCGMAPGAYGSRWPLPAGLLVVSMQQHSFFGEQITAASVHCLDRDRWGKKRSAPGVSARATVLRPIDGPAEVVMIMESAVDALLAWEASGRRALAVGVGGAWAPDADADAAICEAVDAGVPVVLVPDADDAGRRCADEYWHRRWPAAMSIEATGGKDLSDADRAARNGVPGALRATEWMTRLRERLRGQTPATSRAELVVE